MRKLIVAIVVMFTFGSAVANSNTNFVLKKAHTNTLLTEKIKPISSKNQCSQTCWNNLQSCLASSAPFSFCSQQFTQCIDTCEGAGSLYR